MIETTVPVRCTCGCEGVFEGAVVELTRRCVVVEGPRGWIYFDRITGEGMGGTRGVACVDPSVLPTLAPTEASA